MIEHEIRVTGRYVQDRVLEALQKAFPGKPWAESVVNGQIVIEGPHAYARVLKALEDLGKVEYDESKHPRDERGRWTDSGEYVDRVTPGQVKAIQATTERIRRNVAEAYAHADELQTNQLWQQGGANLREHLQFLSDFYKRQEGGDDPKRNPALWKLQYGRSYPFTAASFAGEREEQHACYKNATLGAASDPNLTYVEGYVGIHGVPLEHAWLVDPKGHVIDPTIREVAAVTGYYGVPFQTSYLKKATVRNKLYGLLTWQNAGKTIADNPNVVVEHSALRKFNPNHDERGRFAEAESVGLPPGMKLPAVDAIRVPYGSEPAIVMTNPSEGQIKQLASKSGSARVLRDGLGNLYAWDSEQALHHDVAAHFGGGDFYVDYGPRNFFGRGDPDSPNNFKPDEWFLRHGRLESGADSSRNVRDWIPKIPVKIRQLYKFNPNHDEQGRFATGGGLLPSSSQIATVATPYTGNKKIEVLTNPSLKDAKGMARDSYANMVRVLRDKAGNIYMWDSDKSIHFPMEVALGLEGKVGPGDADMWFMNRKGQFQSDNGAVADGLDPPKRLFEIPKEWFARSRGLKVSKRTIILKYSPDQLRDERGRWTAGGTVRTSDVYEATRALYEGKRVELSQPREASILIDHLGQVTKRMLRMGMKAPNFDLCKVTITGTNLFCADTKGIPRAQMPQVGRAIKPQFFDYLKENGYKIAFDRERASYMRPTQNQLNGAAVAGLAQKMRDGGFEPNPIVVSRDSYILDGHHQWAATIAIDAENNRLGDRWMPVARVDASITELMRAADDFTEGKGRRELHHVHQEVSYLKFDPNQPRDEHGRWTDVAGLDKSKPVSLVFSGSFNPPHAGHQSAVQQSIDWMKQHGYKVERTLVVPSPTRLIDKKLGAGAYPLHERVQMTKLQFAGIPGVDVTGAPSEAAAKFEGKLRRTHTADFVREQYPGTQVVSVTGHGDAPETTHGAAPEDRTALFTGKPGSSHEGYAYLSLVRPQEAVSSTKIRQALREGTPLPEGTSPAVAAYVQDMFRRRPDIRKREGQHLVAIAASLEKFDPSQPRDEHGRWTQGGLAPRLLGWLKKKTSIAELAGALTAGASGLGIEVAHKIAIHEVAGTVLHALSTHGAGVITASVAAVIIHRVAHQVGISPEHSKHWLRAGFKKLRAGLRLAKAEQEPDQELAELLDHIIAALDNVDLTVSKYDPNEPRDERGRWTDGGTGLSFVSPNVGTVDFKTAQVELRGGRQAAIRSAVERVDKEMGHTGVTSDAIGAWRDGAENSTVGIIKGATWDELKAAAAMKGWLANQKQVLVFQQGAGNKDHYLATFHAKGDLADIHKGLLDSGLEYHTLSPSGSGAVVYLYGQKQKDLDAAAKYAAAHDVKLQVRFGHGEFIGTQKGDADGDDAYQRQDARRAYEEDIAAAAKRGGGRIGRVWDRVRDYYRQSLDTVKRHRLLEAIQKEWDESKHPREPKGSSAGGEFTSAGGAGAAAVEELHPHVVEVGGDEWNKQTAIRLEREYQKAKPALEQAIATVVGAERSIRVKPQSWDNLTQQQQEEAEENYVDHYKYEEINNQESNWHDNGDAKTDAANMVSTAFNENPPDHDSNEWAMKALQEYREQRAEEGKPELPYTDEQLMRAMAIPAPDYSYSKAEPKLEFDDSKLQSPKGFEPNQLTLPGVEPIKPEEMLSPKVREELTVKMLAAYEVQVEDEESKLETPDWIEDSAVESLKESFNDMDDEAKYNYAKKMLGLDTATERPARVTIPSKFDPIGDYEVKSNFDVGGQKGKAYRETQAFAQAVSEQRAAELLVERGLVGSEERDLKPGGKAWQEAVVTAYDKVRSVDTGLWSSWKSSSTSAGGKILQLATAEELGGRLRSFSEYTREQIKESANSDYQMGLIGGYEGVKALVRAKWETTQYMLEKAGRNELGVYRGVTIPESKAPGKYEVVELDPANAKAQGYKYKVDGPDYGDSKYFHSKESAEEHAKIENEAAKARAMPSETVKIKGVGTYDRLTDITIERNGAASTTANPKVANDWGSSYSRVVLRAMVPRTAVVSVPAYGINVHGEQEVVVAGTAWKKWDAWRKEAPTFADHPIHKIYRYRAAA